MSRVHRRAALSIVLLMLGAELAHAGLLRTSGRGTLSRNFSTPFYFVDNSNVNEIGITDAAWGEFGENFSSNSITRTIGGGGRGVASVPNDCLFGYTDDDLRFAEEDEWRLFEQFDLGEISEAELDAGLAAIDARINGTPCAWEFEEGEPLVTFGFFSLFFGDADVLYDVTWGITGNGVSLNLPGSINRGGDLPAPDDPAFSIREGWVTLDAPQPASLGLEPGTYDLDVSVSLSSSSGTIFWERNEPFNEVRLERICEFNPAFDDFYADDSNFDSDGNILPGLEEPEPEICGRNSSDDFGDSVIPAPSFFSSESEILRILPSSMDDDDTDTASPVPAPSTFTALLGGLAGLLAARRRRSRSAS